MLRKLTRGRGTEPRHCHGFQSSLGRKEGAAALYPFKGWEVGGADWSRAALTHARRMIDAGDVTKFGVWPGPAAGARGR